MNVLIYIYQNNISWHTKGRIVGTTTIRNKGKTLSAQRMIEIYYEFNYDSYELNYALIYSNQ